MRNHTPQHVSSTPLLDDVIGAGTIEDTTIHLHFRVSSSFPRLRAEILILGTLPGEAFFTKKWGDKRIVVSQIVRRGRMIYRCRLARGKEIGHEWCGHDTVNYPRRIRHGAITGHTFYVQHRHAQHHSLVHPERVREFPNRIDLIMPIVKTEVPSLAQDTETKPKFKRGDEVVVKGSSFVMVVGKVSGAQVTCKWVTPAGNRTFGHTIKTNWNMHHRKRDDPHQHTTRKFPIPRGH